MIAYGKSPFLFIFFYLLFIYLSMRRYTWASVHAWALSNLVCKADVFLWLFPQLIDSPRLDRLRAPGSCLFLSTVTTEAPWELTLKSSCVCGTHFSKWSISPAGPFPLWPWWMVWRQVFGILLGYLHDIAGRPMTRVLRSRPSEGCSQIHWDTFLELLRDCLYFSGFSRMVGDKTREAGSHVGTNRIEPRYSKSQEVADNLCEALPMPGCFHIFNIWNLYEIYFI